MSFLAPLFLLGALAVSLPIIFHLIRRTSREKTAFSSLMFLMPSPPRITRRSRLENIFLLLLRCLVFCLLALGFARPFFQHAMPDSPSSQLGKKIVLLLDTSASMRRGNLWREATAKAEQILRRTAPADQVAVLTFDRRVNRVLSFEQWASMGAGDRIALGAKKLQEINPGWFGTHLGNALVNAAETLEEGRDSHPQIVKQIVLISDLQEGSRLDTLQSYEWPKGIELIVEPVKARRPTNAGLQLVTDRDELDKAPANAGPRVRVSNSADGKREQFQVGWARGAEQVFLSAPLDVYVPPGQSRVIQAPKPADGINSERLLLLGDDEDFDNNAYTLPAEAAEVKILFIGSDSEKDPAQSLYYLKRAFQHTRRQKMDVVAHAPSTPLLASAAENIPLIIIADTLAGEPLQQLSRLIHAGKMALLIMQTPAAAQTIARLASVDSLACEEASTGGYAMFGQIDFEHPLFASFADPRFSDFTKIHFWKHRRLETEKIPAAKILARFDDGDPALIQIPIGKGTLLVLASGWHPTDSQLALSSKFVPLLYSVLDQSGASKPPVSEYIVGEAAILAGDLMTSSQPLTVQKPDGSQMQLTEGEKFSQADMPGIYTAVSGARKQRFAVNLESAESKTAPLSIDELERLGLPVKSVTAQAARLSEQKRHRLQAVELENQQKLWRWLIVAALVVLIVETWLAGWLTRRATMPAGATT